MALSELTRKVPAFKATQGHSGDTHRSDNAETQSSVMYIRGYYVAEYEYKNIGIRQ